MRTQSSGEPAVLVGTTASSHKSYILKKYVERITSLTYPNYDVVIVVSQKDKEYGNKIKSEFEKRKFTRFSIAVDAWAAKPPVRVTSHHNKLREITLLNNYDYLLIIDQDIIPPKDVIEKMLSVKEADVVVGVYKIQNEDGEVYALWQRRLKLENNKLKAVWLTENEINDEPMLFDGGFGTGCCLIKRKVLEYVYFRAGAANNNFQDGVFWYDLENLGFKVYVHGGVRCEHYPSDWTPLFESYAKEANDKTLNKNILTRGETK